MKKIKKPHVSYHTGNNEWYTPREYIETARAMMGSIDTDPASTEQANQIVRARTFYTKETDGLTKGWEGNVWLNPPYARHLIGRFADMITEKFISGELTQALVLVNNATETKWFQKISSVSSAVCFPNSRIRFINSLGRAGSPTQGQCIFYCGQKIELFRKYFSPLGTVLYKTQTETLNIFCVEILLASEASFALSYE